MCTYKERAMNQRLLACVLIAAPPAGCTQPFPHESGAQLSINRAPAAAVSAKEGTTPEVVGATAGSGGGEVGFEYWKY